MSTARTLDQKINMSLALNEALFQAMEKDPTVLVFGEDVIDNPRGGVFGVTNGLSTAYGDRVRSTPIAEQAIVGAAVGTALGGYRPVAEVMLMNFLTLGMDMLSNHAAKLRYMSGGQTNVPLTLRTAAVGGKGFGAQHSEMLESWLVHIPGLKVVMPSNAADAKGLLTACIFDDDPCVFIEQVHLYYSPNVEVPPGHYEIPIGVADVKRAGRDVSVITYGRQVGDALEVAEQLSAEGIEVEVVDLRTLSPRDMTTVFESVARTRRAVVAHEAVREGGIGAEVAAQISEELHGQLDAPVRRVGAPFTPIPFAASLERLYLPGAAEIEAAVRQAVGETA